MIVSKYFSKFKDYLKNNGNFGVLLILFPLSIIKLVSTQRFMCHCYKT